MKLGFIGLGLIGARRIKIAQALGHDIVFAVEPDPIRRDAVTAATRAASVDELEVRQADSADAVFIAVPHDLALGICQWAFRRRMHVLCEKPMGLTAGQAREIAALAQAAGKQFCAGFNYRYLLGIAALRDMVRAGNLGQLYRIRLAMGHGGRPGMEQEWKLKQVRAGGGALIDPGIHLVDLALHLAGPAAVTNVGLRKRFWQSDVEDNCLLTLQTQSGDIDLTIEVSLTAWKNFFTVEIQGSDGVVTLGGRGGNYGSQRVEFTNRWFWKDNDARSVEDLGVNDPSFEIETRAFLDLIAGGVPDGILSGAADGIAALDVVQAAYAKARKSASSR
jgi:predicted dehydrogenase